MGNHHFVHKSLLFKDKICTPYVSNSLGIYSKSHSLLRRQDFYICSLSSILLDNNKYESCRKVATRIIKRQKRKGVFFGCFKFTLPYTRKSKNARMGKGKGSFHKFVQRLNCFSPLFYLHNVSFICAASIMQQIETKLPIRLCLFSVKYLYTRHTLHAVNNSFCTPFAFDTRVAYKCI
jgi:ribosomal protein L16/L10AE